MSRPYLAFTWPAGCPATTQAAGRLAAELRAGSDWRPAWRGEGLEVWTSAARPLAVVPCPFGSGVVIGDLFRRALPRRAPTPPRNAMPAGVGAAAAALCDDHWGAYVALLPEASGTRVWGLRDPSGALDALTWRRGRLAFLASDVAGLPMGAAPPDAALDWAVIAAVLAEPTLALDRTALNLDSLVPGALQPLDAGRAAAVTLWRPSDFARAAVDTGEDLGPQVRACIEATVDALASRQGGISLEVSGGLDSSIVAAALVAAGRRDQVVAATNYHASETLADERTWARAVGDHLGLPLVCVPREVPPFDPSDYAALADHARPPLNALDAPRDRQGADLARQAGASAIFGGKGGDGVFLERSTALVLADRLRARGPGGLLGPWTQSTARWLRRSVWSVAFEAARAAWRRDARGEGDESARHPWLEELAGVPPAKRFQIAALAAAQAHRGINRRSLAADLVHPFLAQPVVELCLSIPAWRLVEGAGELRGRGLVRRAFADALPAAVISRRSKGDLTEHYSRWVAASREPLADLLLDGTLADAGLLDRDAVVDALDPDTLISRPDGRALLAAAAVEVWVRRWQSHVPDRGRRPRAGTLGPEG